MALELRGGFLLAEIYSMISMVLIVLYRTYLSVPFSVCTTGRRR